MVHNLFYIDGILSGNTNHAHNNLHNEGNDKYSVALYVGDIKQNKQTKQN